MEQGLNTYYYCVAQHLFAVECADKALLERMSNYEPFRVEAQGEPIFALRIEQDGLLHEDLRSHYTHVFTDNSEEETAVRRTMLQRAKTKVFLCDGSKLGRKSLYRVCVAEELQQIICDQPLPEKISEHIR